MTYSCPKYRPLLLAILDGFALTDNLHGNAVRAARTPNLDRLFAGYPWAKLEASGESVGLPEGQMGNSEVGHLNIGAGRIVYQDLPKITKSIRDGSFFKNEALLAALKNMKNGASLHLPGLLSDGGVHSHNTHLYALLELARRNNVRNVFLHAFLDGRDVPPKSATGYIEESESKMRVTGGKIATVTGRYFAMDRDRRWERVSKAYDAMTAGIGETARSAVDAVKNAYARSETDEFVKPTVICNDSGQPVATIKDGDSVIFFNFRSDRARELTRAFTDDGFSDFRRDTYPDTYFVSFTRYDETFDIPVAFPPEHISNTLGEVLAKNRLRQLRIAETEKYAHVTFFFNGGEETPNPGEERILIPSPKVPTYDLKPEMSAYEITDELIKNIRSSEFDVIILNFANPDMVGHTGIYEAAISAVEAVDECIGRIFDAVTGAGGLMILTGDHGNAEQMKEYGSEKPHTAHTCNPVPLIVTDRSLRLRNKGILADIAPTILELIGLQKPDEMSGTSMIVQ